MFTTYLKNHKSELSHQRKIYGKQIYDRLISEQYAAFHKIMMDSKVKHEQSEISQLLSLKHDLCDQVREEVTEERERVRAKIDGVRLRVEKVEGEIQGVKGHSAKLREQIKEIDYEYGQLRYKVDEELNDIQKVSLDIQKYYTPQKYMFNEILNKENERQGGLIWDTHAKLSEMGEDRRKAEVCIEETQVYLMELKIVSADWEQKTREDIKHLEERIEMMRRHLGQVEVALMKQDVKEMISTNMARAGQRSAMDEDERPSPNVEEIDMELMRSQRSYNQGLQDEVLLKSPPKPKAALERLGSPPTIQIPEEESFMKLRVICQAFNELYEFKNFQNQEQFTAINSIIPLFEGENIFLQRHLTVTTVEQLKKRERLLRLSPDMTKIEIRYMNAPPFFKVDTFFKVETLTGVTITNKTRQLIKKILGITSGQNTRLNSPVRSVKDKDLQKEGLNIKSPVLSSSKKSIRPKTVSHKHSQSFTFAKQEDKTPTFGSANLHMFEFILILQERQIEIVLMSEYARFLRFFNALQSLAQSRATIEESDAKEIVSIFKL